MSMPESRGSLLALLTILVGLLLGGAALWLGVQEGAIALLGFGGAGLLQVPPALSFYGRIQAGLGNQGLERERLTWKVVSLLIRFLALGMAMASVSALLGERGTQASLGAYVLAGCAVGSLGALWFAKRQLVGVHAALDLDTARTRALLELAALLLAGCFLSRWFPWADAATALVIALRLFLAGHTLAKASTLQAAACGGCGSGCGCG